MTTGSLAFDFTYVSNNRTLKSIVSTRDCKISSSKISLLEVEGPLSMCACKEMLLILKMKDGAQTVKGIHFQISQSSIWNYTVTFNYVPSRYVGRLFSFIPCITERHFWRLGYPTTVYASWS